MARFRELIERLPALPANVSELLALQQEDPALYDRIHGLCARDPGLASSVLRQANAAAAAPMMELRSLRDALIYVGARPALSGLLAPILVEIFEPRSNVLRSIWCSSVWIAVAARELAPHCQGAGDADEAHTAGLLQDVGRLVLAWTDEVNYEAALCRSLGEPRSVLSEERRLYGADHPHIGGKLATRWGLPPDVGEAIAQHHQTLPATPLARVLALADQLLHWQPHLEEPDPTLRRLGLGCELESLDDLVGKRQQIEELARPEIERLSLMEHREGNSDHAPEEAACAQAAEDLLDDLDEIEGLDLARPELVLPPDLD